MTEEYLDILNEKGELTGESGTSKYVHGKGLLHRVVHVWILDKNKKLLLQKRSLKMTAYANYWDISSAGHISTGQTSIEAAQRETEEELGLTFPSEIFKYLFTIEDRAILRGN